MAEEHFTSRRARREAERRAAEQAFEARSAPEESNGSGVNSRAELLTPAEPGPTGSRPAETEDASEQSATASPAPTADDSPSRIDPDPSPQTVHERGALASDHPQETRPPVSAEDRLDPRRAPLPHFETRAERKRYLREHGLSMQGDLSTGAIPVIAEPEEADAEAAGRREQSASAEPESFDTAGFGGASDEVAARDFESPVTPDSAPRPSPVESRQPASSAEPPAAAAEPSADEAAEAPTSEPAGSEPAAAEAPSPAAEPESAPTPAASPASPASAASPAGSAGQSPRPRARRMPIVQPPTTAGVRVVTAASAKVPDPETRRPGADSTTGTRGQGSGARTTGAPTTESAARPEPTTSPEAAGPTADAEAAGLSPDEAARAMAANPETRPMEAVPEAWALPNRDYEDEETENPPGTRIRAAAVTGNDGQILVGEEPSKVPYVVLGVAALVAIGLIVVALVMLL